MQDILDKLPLWTKELKNMREIILANIVLTGQIPSPTFEESARAEFFLERLSDFQADECTTDNFGNPIGIIRGTEKSKPPIMLVAHIDTFFEKHIGHNYTIKDSTVSGAGIIDNTTGVAFLLSVPEILRRLNLTFKSDIILAAPIQSIGEANLKGVRKLLKNWKGPIKAAICIEGGELGRLSYFADGMIRAEINCSIPVTDIKPQKYPPNAILLLNEIINKILQIRLPQKPRTKIIISKISGGKKYGDIAHFATMGLEIHSDCDKTAKEIYETINDIINGIICEHKVKLTLRIISNVYAANLQYTHPLVKNTLAIMKKLGIQPITKPSESELSIFLENNIPALTVGLTNGQNYHLENAEIKIQPLFKGIAQVLGIVSAIDQGKCDEPKNK